MLNKFIKSTEAYKRIVKKRDDLVLEKDKLIEERDRLSHELDRAILRQSEVVEKLEATDKRFSEFRKSAGFVPPGHFYSALPSLEEVRENESKIFGRSPDEIKGIDLHEEQQLILYEQFVGYYKDMTFPREKSVGYHYYYENPAYSYSDGIHLYCMIRSSQPQRIIEVGCGYSSCMMIDTISKYLEKDVSITFIEPYPDLLESLLNDSKQNIKIIPERVQDVNISEFDKLQRNDILFIDSTHISKVGSDVNHLIFEVLPALSPGVLVHFHDIFYPFEYPKRWIYAGRSWSEVYLLRAFLQHSDTFRLKYMNTYMQHKYRDRYISDMPLCMKNTGASIWIEKYR